MLWRTKPESRMYEVETGKDAGGDGGEENEGGGSLKIRCGIKGNSLVGVCFEHLMRRCFHKSDFEYQDNIRRMKYKRFLDRPLTFNCIQYNARELCRFELAANNILRSGKVSWVLLYQNCIHRKQCETFILQLVYYLELAFARSSGYVDVEWIQSYFISTDLVVEHNFDLSHAFDS
ncbi:hypothetical protein EVAR_59817_1 [Eumeta japonica]|uniref:Uncharacterized protein n=1 Tax=Eumeta variegata TaxID=151549 RepID=A0A4C1ZD36_EUMVA|nr:hypothetical protein EVAR_59817_1 [Eumeta japonica]